MVKMTGENPAEVAAIVNAVVKSYLAKTKTWTDDALAQQIDGLAKLESELKMNVERLQTKVRELSKQAGDVPDDAAPRGRTEARTARFKYQLTMDQYRHLNTELARLKIERYKAEAAVKFFEDEINRSAATRWPPSPPAR